MEEMIAVEGVSPSEFADRYNQYNESNGRVESPLGRKVIKCISYNFYLDKGTQVDALGRYYPRGSGLIIVSAEPRQDELGPGVF